MSSSSIEITNKNNSTKQSFIEWEKVTILANEAFKEGHLFCANCLYEKAADKAKYLFSKLVCNRDSIATLLVSFHNLAYFHLAYNNKRYALDCLTEVVSCLTDRLKSNDTDCSKEAALVWGLGQANLQLWLIERELKHESACVGQIN